MGAENELSYRGSPLLLTGKTSLTDICKTASVTVSLLSFPGHIIPLLDQEPGTEEEGGQVKCLGGKWNLWAGGQELVVLRKKCGILGMVVYWYITESHKACQ